MEGQALKSEPEEVMRTKDTHQSLAHRKKSTEADILSVNETTKLLHCIAFPTPVGTTRDPEISTQKTTHSWQVFKRLLRANVNPW